MGDLIDRQKLLYLIELERAWLEELDIYNLNKNLCKRIIHIIETMPGETNISINEYDKTE